MPLSLLDMEFGLDSYDSGNLGFLDYLDLGVANQKDMDVDALEELLNFPEDLNNVDFNQVDLGNLDATPLDVKAEQMHCATGFVPAELGAAEPPMYPIDSNVVFSPPGVSATPQAPTITSEQYEAMGMTDTAETGEPKDRRRRRRVRNAKQQELNRLAQQRYRERKKQKYSTLQSTVDTLATQLDKLKVLEEEKAQLVANNQKLEKLVMLQEEKIRSQQQQLLKREEEGRDQATTINNQNSQIAELQGKVDAQQQELECLKQQLKTTTDLACHSMESCQMKEKLNIAFQSIIHDVNEGKGWQQALSQLQLPDALLQQITKAICSCCRELCVQLKKSSSPAAPTAIQVPCC